MIVVTGASGFIGTNLILALRKCGFTRIVAVDDFTKDKQNNRFLEDDIKVDRTHFIEWSKKRIGKIDFIFHLGARTDTTEFDEGLLQELNTAYSKEIWSICTAKGIPLVYASSAATYGMGEHGFTDDESKIELLNPLNPYARSKNRFDLETISATKSPPLWVGLKFFNVYGPYEDQKGKMSSMVYQSFLQIKKKGKVQLFKSYHPEFQDGEQKRDFVYVKDVVSTCIKLMERPIRSGIYNLGAGKARSFNQLVKCLFIEMSKPIRIEYIEMPESIKSRYQYFTEARMDKLINAGIHFKPTDLNEGIQDYYTRHLLNHGSNR